MFGIVRNRTMKFLKNNPNNNFNFFNKNRPSISCEINNNQKSSEQRSYNFNDNSSSELSESSDLSEYADKSELPREGNIYQEHVCKRRSSPIFRHWERSIFFNPAKAIQPSINI